MHTTEQINAALAGRYTIERRIGEGGMATVYLARDVKHNRRVALKVLKPDLGAVVGVERFLSEIEVTANLQHPNLLPLFDSGAADGLLFYVMPFVEGESLRARLDREKQLPIDEAVRIASAIASALDYAHRHGVIHRDLKPENILLHDGQPVVADFGIALAVSNAGGNRITQTGLSLGTPQYMSPEQATGDRAIDARTDIYSLGAVTYEMLTGEAPHTGSTSQAVIARVLTEKPRAVHSSRPNVPAHVESAVARALEKLPADRWASAKEFSEALAGARVITVAATGAQVAPDTSATRTSVIGGRPRAREAAAWLLAFAGIAAAGSFAPRKTDVPIAGRFGIELPESVSIAGGGPRMAISRDGKLVVVSAAKPGRPAGLYVRRITDMTAQFVRGTDSAQYAAFSPDGNWLLFRVGQQLRKIPVVGGTSQRVVDSCDGEPASWGDNGKILYVRRRGLWIVSEDGGDSRLLAQPDTTRGFVRYYLPEVLPGGHAALVTVLHRAANVADSAYVGVVSLDDGVVKDLGVRGANAHFAAPGHVLFARPGGLVLVAPFSLRKLNLTGPAELLLEGVATTGTSRLDYGVARNGTLAYHTGAIETVQQRAVFSVDRAGLETPLTREPTTFSHPRISPDGRHVVVTIGARIDGTRSVGDLWLFEPTAGGTLTRLTSDTSSIRGEWTRDGARILYVNQPHADTSWIRSVPWDRSRPDTALALGTSDGINALNEVALGPARGWSAFRIGDNGGVANTDIWIAPTDSLSAKRPFITKATRERTPRISPDGKLLAYVSPETGRSEVYVCQIPGEGPHVKVSTDGGTEPMWSPTNPSVLYYRGPARVMMATLTQRPALSVTSHDSLFVDRYMRDEWHAGYDVFPDDRHFLMVRPLSAPTTAKNNLFVVVNWQQLIGAQRGSGDER